jgi:hypothetical protein
MELAKTVRPENKPHLETYLSEKRLGNSSIGLIIGSIYGDTLSYHGVDKEEALEQLQKLRLERKDAEIKAMKTRLLKIKYQLDGPASIEAVVGTYQTEVVSRHAFYGTRIIWFHACIPRTFLA